MEKLNKIEIANSEENSEDLILNDTHYCEHIMRQGTARSNILSDKIQVDGHRELENIVSRVPVHDVQYKAVNSQPLKVINRPLNQYQTKYDKESSSNMSIENHMLEENQAYPIDLSSSSALDLSISKDECDMYSTNNEIQNRSDVHDIHECKIPTANNFQNSIYVRDIEQPSSSYVNNNLNSITQPSHPVIKPFSCKTCYKKYTSRFNLKRHLEAHIEKKQFFCSECNKQLAEKEYIVHMLDHSKEKPFQCSVCNWQCALNWNLKQHMVIHTREKLYTCYVCKEKFNRKDNLKVHMLTHAK